MEIALTIAVAVLCLLLGFTIVAYYRLRALLHHQARRNKPRTRDHPPQKPPPDGHTCHTSAADNAALDIPAVLVGAQWKAFLERLAPILGMTPVELLRAALCAGLTGGRPITAEMLELLDKLAQEQKSKSALPSKPGRYRPH